MTSETNRAIPVVDGLFTTGPEPALLGGRRPNGSYVFPYGLGGGDPSEDSDEVERVELSRFGRLWSWTDSRYRPPPPFVATTEPFEPIVIVAVELERERMIVLGQAVEGITTDELRLGQRMELVLGPAGTLDGEPRVVWKWAPRSTNGDD